MEVFHRSSRHWVQWAAHDALVLQWVVMQVEGVLPSSERVRWRQLIETVNVLGLVQR
uniref:hypothetical protein n=1 Tax=Pectobacterium carotovorum TaxID=554 RepID=UPI001D133A7B|nr:hypothetical protein [Pectobacterium carotovorum]